MTRKPPRSRHHVETMAEEMPDHNTPQRDRRTPPRIPQRMFETRSLAWKEVGLLRQISPRVVKRARLEALVLVPLFVGVVIIYDNRVSLFGTRAARHVHGRTLLIGPKTLEAG